MVGKRIAILQSNYIPWKGYFDLIRRVDEFVLYDDVQYTRRDWRNRNRIKTAGGLRWLTIPVQVKGRYKQTISETLVSDSGWAASHWRTLQHEYARAHHFHEYSQRFGEVYDRAATLTRLSDINVLFLTELMDIFGIRTRLAPSSRFDLAEGRTDRLVGICQQAGASTYVTGPAARDYLDERLFAAAGIGVEYMDYAGYPEYPQLHPPFEHAVSAVDLVFNVGAAARDYI